MYSYEEHKLAKKNAVSKESAVIQTLLSPHVPSARSEFANAGKRRLFFNNVTQVQEAPISELLLQDAITTDEANGAHLAYRTNPRAKRFPAEAFGGAEPTQDHIKERQGLKNYLEAKTMSDVIQDPGQEPGQGQFLLTQKSLPVGEYTFVLKDNAFTIAPNSSSSKFVHPMLLGGWQYVDSAGTLELQKDHIRVTKDSGHYRPSDVELDLARNKLAEMFGDVKANRPQHGFIKKYKNVRHNPQ